MGDLAVCDAEAIIDSRPAPAGLMSTRATRELGWNAAIAVAYVAAGYASLSAATEHRAVSSLWLPAGISLFALLRLGPRYWPGVAVAAYILNASNGLPLVASVVMAGGETLEALLGAWLVRRAWGANRGPVSPRQVVQLVGLAGLVSTMLGATVGVATLVAAGATTTATAGALWLVWWTGDAVGVVVVAPLLLAWVRSGEAPPHGRWPRIEFAVAFGALAAGTYFLFANWGTLVFAIFPLAGWIALRMGMRGATTAVAVVTVVAGWCTLAGYGPFTAMSPTANLFALQLFLMLLAVKSLFIAALQAETRAAGDRLRISERRYRMLAQHLPDGCVVLFDRDVRLLLAEGPAVAAAGFVQAEVEGRTLDEIFEPATAERLLLSFRDVLQGREVEFEFPFRDHTYLVRALPLADEDHADAAGMALALDVTAREATQQEVAASRARLERLSRLLISAHEDERRRIAREVHDELGQALTAVKIGLATALQRTQQRGSLDSERHVRIAAATLDQAIESVQHIVLRLRPGVLDNLGPIAAIEHAAQQFSQQAGVPVRLELLPEPLDLDGERSTTLYRIVQEALTNVMRHARARGVSVSLREDIDAGTLLLRIVDDGAGIDDEQVRNPRSMGILGMRERAAACGGWLELQHAPGGGTAVLLTMPRDDTVASGVPR